MLSWNFREKLQNKKGLRLVDKTEYMERNFSKKQCMNEGVVNIEVQEIPKSEQFQ